MHKVGDTNSVSFPTIQGDKRVPLVVHDRQYACNLESVLSSEFPDWAVTVIPGSEDAVEIPIDDPLENFRTEFRVRDLMTESLMKAVDDCKHDHDMP